jgi:hypothetical protein
MERPFHLLLLNESPTDHLVDRQFHERVLMVSPCRLPSPKLGMNLRLRMYLSNSQTLVATSSAAAECAWITFWREKVAEVPTLNVSDTCRPTTKSHGASYGN